MADVVVFQRFWCRRGTAAAWTAANPTLAAGEWGVETDTQRLKMGDGSTAWNSLSYHLTVPMADPGADRLLFWDDSAGAWTFLDLGTNLSISGTTLNASSGGSSGGGGASSIDPSARWEEYYDLADYTNAEFVTAASPSGTVTYTGMAGHPGVATISTASVSSTSVGLLRNPSPLTSKAAIFAGSGELVFVALVNINTLWAGANTGQYRVGFLDEISGAPTNGIHAQYDNTSGNWQLYHRNAGVNTSITGGTAVATGWWAVKIVTDAAAGSSELFVWQPGGTPISQGVLTGNVPSAGFTYGAMVQKSAGSTASIMDVDLFHVWQTFTTARY